MNKNIKLDTILQEGARGFKINTSTNKDTIVVPKFISLSLIRKIFCLLHIPLQDKNKYLPSQKLLMKIVEDLSTKSIKHLFL